MPTRFADQVALVTGAGSGIGRATARALARDGATVVVAGRTAERLAETVELVEYDGGKASAVTADVTSAEDVERLVDTTVRRHGGLHVAVNNAGVLAAAPLAELTQDAWDRLLAVNVTGVWLSMKYEIAHMSAHGGGAIVNVGSNLGAHVSVPGLSAYGATKAAVSALTRTAAREYIGAGVRINVVSPGPSDTSMSMRPGEDEQARAERLRAAVPVGRVGSLDEVAATVLWLASVEAGYAVGHDLVIDGGASA